MRTPDWQSDDGAIRLYLGDCLDLLPTIPAGAVDIAATSPPYNIKGGTHGASGMFSEDRCGPRKISGAWYDDAMPEDDYWKWLNRVVSECRRVCAGLVWINHKVRFQDRKHVQGASMTIQEIISAVASVYPQPNPGWKGSRRHLASSRRVVVKLARVYLPHLGYSDIKKGLGLHAHSSVIGAARKAPTLAEAQAFADAEKLLVKKPQPIPPPASQPHMSEGARAIIGTLNADATARNEVLAYLRGVLTVAETVHRATAQQVADRQNQPGTIQGVAK